MVAKRRGQQKHAWKRGREGGRKEERMRWPKVE
jgi:hypothetical protein